MSKFNDAFDAILWLFGFTKHLNAVWSLEPFINRVLSRQFLSDIHETWKLRPRRSKLWMLSSHAIITSYQSNTKNRCPNQGLEVRAEQTPTQSGPSPLDHAFSPKVTQSYPELLRVTQSCPKLSRVTQSYPELLRVTQSYPKTLF